MKLDDVLFFNIRHATTNGNEKGTYRSWSNGPDAQLNAQGRREAAQAGRFLLSIGAPIEIFVTDSLDRVQETVEIVSESFPNARIETVRGLHPLNVGDYTGKSKDKYPIEPFMKDTSKKIPGGESLDEFNGRQDDVFRNIFDLVKSFPNGRLAVAGHGSNTAYLYNHVFNQGGPRLGYEGLVDPGGVYAATARGLVPLLKARDKKDKKLVQIENKFDYPPNDELAIEVPKGGSSCKTCKYLGADEKTCTSKDFIAWEGPDKPAGSDKLPMDYDRYCSIWYFPAEGTLDGK